jgi:hypothetical protein
MPSHARDSCWNYSIFFTANFCLVCWTLNLTCALTMYSNIGIKSLSSWFHACLPLETRHPTYTYLILCHQNTPHPLLHYYCNLRIKTSVYVNSLSVTRDYCCISLSLMLPFQHAKQAYTSVPVCLCKTYYQTLKRTAQDDRLGHVIEGILNMTSYMLTTSLGPHVQALQSLHAQCSRVSMAVCVARR